MTTSAILLGAATALLVIFYITRPFRERWVQSAEAGKQSQRQQLLEQKAAIYAAIKEIDADVAVGKLEAADHQTLRRRYLAEGVTVLKSLEALPADDPVDAAMENDIARWSEGERPTGAAQTCPACGVAVDPSDKFCAKCGQALRGA